MRILHTSDWHLGHTLHSMPRDHEHARFLDWLAETLEAEQVDVLVVAGDVFDTANPPAGAQAAWYGFLAAAAHRFPWLQVVVVGGNHDSAARLDAPEPILRALRVRVVGGLPRDRAGALDPERLVLPLTNRRGQVRAWCAAVPFLRPADLPPVAEEGLDPLVEGVRQVYAGALQAARARREPGQALLSTGHCYMTGTRLSELSERKILGGNQHALPVDIFPDDVTYAALGHLHLAQSVGGRDNVRYSGSPIPLSMAEVRYRHQVCLVELDGERLAEVRCLPVPRSVELLRVPAGDPAEPEAVFAALRQLEAMDATPYDLRPYLEVAVLLERPDPGLRRRVEEALDGRLPRLVKLTVCYPGDGRALGDRVPGRALSELLAEDVFRALYQRKHRGEPPPELMAAFSELLDEVQA